MQHRLIIPARQPSFAVDEMTTALTAGLGAIVEYTDKEDERSVGSALHYEPALLSL